MKSEPPLVLRTTNVMFALVGSILGFVLVIGVAATIKSLEGWWLMVGAACLLASAMSVMLSTKLALTEDAIHYHSFLVKTNIPLADVIRAKFVIGFSGYKPFQRVVVTVRNKPGERDVTINTGLFAPSQIRLRWVDTLNARVPIP